MGYMHAKSLYSLFKLKICPEILTDPQVESRYERTNCSMLIVLVKLCIWLYVYERPTMKYYTCYVRPVNVSLDPGCSGNEQQMQWQYEMNNHYYDYDEMTIWNEQSNDEMTRWHE